MKPFSAKDYLDGFWLHRRASPVVAENAPRSFDVEEIVPLIQRIAGEEGLLIGGCALALLEKHYRLPVRRVKDIDVVSPLRIAGRLLGEPGARAFVRHKTPKMRLKYAYIAVQTSLAKRVRLPFTDPDLNGFSFRYAKLEVPTGIPREPLIDVDLMFSTCVHISKVVAQQVFAGDKMVWVPTPPSLLLEGSEVLRLEHRNLTHAEEYRRRRANAMLGKFSDRLRAALEIAEAFAADPQRRLVREQLDDLQVSIEEGGVALREVGLFEDLKVMEQRLRELL